MRSITSPARTPAGAGEALDLAAVQDDDALLDLLGAGRTPAGAGGTLASCLAAWRREVQAGSQPSLLATERAVAVLSAAQLLDQEGSR